MSKPATDIDRSDQWKIVSSFNGYEENTRYENSDAAEEALAFFRQAYHQQSPGSPCMLIVVEADSEWDKESSAWD